MAVADALPLEDPQVDEDQRVQRVRQRVSPVGRQPVDVKELVRTWHGWAANSVQRAKLERAKGDVFGEALLLIRAGIREEAAGLLLTVEPAAAARLMMRNAAAHVTRHPPLIDYDQAAMEYTRARSWQFCALAIDPSLPEVQPRWDG